MREARDERIGDGNADHHAVFRDVAKQNSKTVRTHVFLGLGWALHTGMHMC